MSPASATGVGSLAPTALAALGFWNLASSYAAWKRAEQLWQEALKEDWGDASSRNLYGLLPKGTNFDDTCDAYDGPIDYIRDNGWWGIFTESGIF